MVVAEMVRTRLGILVKKLYSHYLHGSHGILQESEEIYGLLTIRMGIPSQCAPRSPRRNSSMILIFWQYFWQYFDSILYLSNRSLAPPLLKSIKRDGSGGLIPVSKEIKSKISFCGNKE